jgi:hypothetical protein
MAPNFKIIENPPDMKNLQHYLGMVNFYCRFTPGIAAVLELFTSSLKGGKTTLEWTAALDSAFQHSKQVLAAPNTAIAMATRVRPHFRFGSEI